MKCFTLIILGCLIASIVLVNSKKTLKPETEIRFGYGMRFVHIGQMLHGLNRYSLMVALKIPDFTLPVVDIKNVPIYSDQSVCRHKMHPNEILYNSCKKLWPIYLENLKREQNMRDKINYILEVQLPAIVPNYKMTEIHDELSQNSFDHTQYYGDAMHSGNNSQLNKHYHRQKRFAGLISLAVQGISYLHYKKKFSQIKKAFKVMSKVIGKNTNRIHHLETDMMTLAQASLKEFEYLRTNLYEVKKDLNECRKQINILSTEIHGVHRMTLQNRQTIWWLTSMMSILFGKMEHVLSVYEQILLELHNLLDALDNLSTGHLSHHVIAPDLLKQYLAEVIKNLEQNYPEYELVTEEITDYYNMPFVNFGYHNGTIAVEIPIFIKPKVQDPLYLFQVDTVPVPYSNSYTQNPNLKKSKQDAYTWIKPKKPLLAMSTETYIDLDNSEINNCLKYGNNYLCEDLLLTKHRSLHSCSSAIYWETSFDTIKDLCPIEYYTHLEPKPQILDGGDYLLLAGLPQPWTYHCAQEDQIPTEIQGGPYQILHKSQLCMCSLLADNTWFLQGNMKYCNNSTHQPLNELKFYHSVNMVVGMYVYKEELLNRQINDTSLFDNPPFETEPEKPNILSVKDDEVLEAGKIPYDFKAAIATIGSGGVYGTKEDMAVDLIDIDKIFSNNGWLGFAIIGAFVACIVAMLAMFLLKKYLDLRNDQNVTSGIVGQIRKALKVLVPTVAANANIPGAEAKAINDMNSNFVMLDYKILLEIFMYTFIFIIVIKIMYYFVKICYKYIAFNNLTIYNYKPNLFSFMLVDKSDIYIVLTSRCLHKTVPIYIGSYIGLPNHLEISGHLNHGHVWYDKNCMLSNIKFLWTNYKVKLVNKEIDLPDAIPISLIQSFKIWYYFRNKTIMYQLVSVNNHIKSSRSLTSTCMLSLDEPELVPEQTSVLQNKTELENSRL